MSGPHYHVLDARDALYGTYPDHRTAARVARRIRRREDINAWVFGLCHAHQCRYRGLAVGQRPGDRALVRK